MNAGLQVLEIISGLVIPYPFHYGSTQYYLNVDVYDRRPTESQKPIARYEYRRTIKERGSNFLLFLAWLPVAFTPGSDNVVMWDIFDSGNSDVNEYKRLYEQSTDEAINDICS
jgi:hypothetical protein